MWVPGSRTELAVVADNFVKIYNLSADTYSPQYYFVVMSGKVKDVTFAVNQQVRSNETVWPVDTVQYSIIHSVFTPD